MFKPRETVILFKGTMHVMWSLVAITYWKRSGDTLLTCRHSALVTSGQGQQLHDTTHHYQMRFCIVLIERTPAAEMTYSVFD